MGIRKSSSFFAEDRGFHQSLSDSKFDLNQELENVKNQALHYKSELDSVKRDVQQMRNELHQTKREYHHLQSWTVWLKGGLALALGCLFLGAGSGVLRQASWSVFTHNRVNLATR